MRPVKMTTGFISHAEGSVLIAAREPQGSAPDVAPENFAHPVYRSGFALALPIPLELGSKVRAS